MNSIQFNKQFVKDYFSRGFESTIFEYQDLNLYSEPVLLKKFNSEVYPNLDFYKNKINKLYLISLNEYLSNEIEFLDLVFDEKEFVGYTMKKVDFTPISAFDKRKNKIYFLKLLRDKITTLNNQDIYIGDFNTKNFLTSKNKDILKLCDLDNLRIGEFDFDIMDNAQKNFMRKCGNVKLIDSYCFNLFTISFLQNYDFSYLCRYLSWSHFSRIFSNPENEEIFDSMLNLGENYEGKFLIDNIKTKSKIKLI